MADATEPVLKTIELQTPFDLILEYIVESGVQIWQGAAVAIGSSGNLDKASAVGASYTVGRAEQSVLGDGEKRCRVRTGAFLFDNGSNALTIANRFGPCYWEDDHTVGSDSGTGIFAGIVVDVTADGVIVAAGLILPASSLAAETLAKANNLSDVADAAAALGNLGGLAIASNLSDVANANAARTNIGANKVYLPMAVSVDQDGHVVRRAIQSPCAGTITSIASVLSADPTIVGDVLASDVTLTSKINGVAVTGGAVVIAASGSAAGDKDSATPSAANAVVAGDSISIDVSGSSFSNGVIFSDLIIEITLPAT